jgi:hypothetical protein
MQLRADALALSFQFPVMELNMPNQPNTPS